MFTPLFTASRGARKAGRVLWARRVYPLFITCSEPWSVSADWLASRRQFNPHRDLANGAITLGLDGRNYGVSFAPSLYFLVCAAREWLRLRALRRYKTASR